MGSLIGWGWGRDWQELMPSASPVSPLQEEAAELGGGGGPAAPEGAVHFCKCHGRTGARIGAGAATGITPGKGFPQLGASGWEVMLCLFPGGSARGGRQAAV